MVSTGVCASELFRSSQPIRVFASSCLCWLGAEETLLEEIKRAAHVNLANGSADWGEIGHAGWNGWWNCTVKIGNTKNINVAAVGSAGGTNRWGRLTPESGSWRSNRAGDEAAEDEKGGEWGSHIVGFVGWIGSVWSWLFVKCVDVACWWGWDNSWGEFVIFL